MLRVLFIGDIVGAAGVAYVADRVPSLRREHAIDLVIANAENVAVSRPVPANGFGMSLDLVQQLLRSGVDVITSGNHAWDHPEADTVLSLPNVLRPLNLPAGPSGRGVAHLTVGGEVVTVINLADALAIPAALPAYPAFMAADRRGIVIVDLHAESPTFKQGFAYAVDGMAAAVLGTHTHEPTLPIHRLPGGSALVVDVGMTGAFGGVAGIDPAHFIARQRGEDPATLPPFRLADGPLVLGAILLTLDGARTVAAERLS